MIPRTVLSRHGYLYNKKNQSPILFEFYQHDMENLMLRLDEAIVFLKKEGYNRISEGLERHKQLIQGKIERHRDPKRGELK